MSCNKCSKNPCCCAVTSGRPYYLDAETCEEDHDKTTYVNQFSFSVCPENSWNIPGCGLTAVLNVPGVIGATIGSFLWNPNYGYYEIVSVDTDKGEIGIVNNCIVGNATPGTQVALCTCFIVTDNANEQLNACELFPYVAIDFIAPAIAACIDIEITNASGISTGDTIAIGSGFYLVDHFTSPTILNICNTGQGIAPGTAVIAKDQFGNCLYPITVAGNCCTEISSDTEEAASGVVTDLNIGGLATVETAPISIVLNNPSASRPASAFVTFLFSYQLSPGTARLWVDADLLVSINAVPYATLLPFVFTEIVTDTTDIVTNQISQTAVYNIAPGTSLTIATKGSLTNNDAAPANSGVKLQCNIKAIKVVV